MARKNTKKTVNPDAPAAAISRDLILLALEDVKVSNEENQRHAPESTESQEAFKSLCDSIREQGLLQPPGVQKRGSAYHLVYGYRRFAALNAIFGGQFEQAFTVIPGGVREARLANYIENANRLDLAPFEHCITLDQMKSDGYETKEIASQIGRSVPHVENMIRVKRNLCKACWEEFVKRGRSAKLKQFIKLAGMKTAAEQVAAMNGSPIPPDATPPGKVDGAEPGKVGKDAKDGTDTDGDTGATDTAGDPPIEPVTRAPLGMMVTDLLDRAESAMMSDRLPELLYMDPASNPDPQLASERLLGIIQACKYLVGQIPDPPVLTGDELNEQE